MTLTAPDHLRGNLASKGKALRDERLAWMLARGREGHTMSAIARALGLGEWATRDAMIKGGHRWHAQKRMIPSRARPRQ